MTRPVPRRAKLMRSRGSAALFALSICTGCSGFVLACRKARTTEDDAYITERKTDAGSAKHADAGSDAAPRTWLNLTDAGLAVDSGNMQDAAHAEDLREESPERMVTEELSVRARHLFEALNQDVPALGRDILYPRDAFVKRRDVQDAGRVWDRKVEAMFAKELHAAHKLAVRQTKGLERAKFQRFELGSAMDRIGASPHEWRVPLYRVAHSKLWFTVEDRAFHVDIAEMVSFRSAWYILRLH